MRKIYAALVIGAAFATCLEVVIGYAAAVEVPRVFFDYFGNDFGVLLVNVFATTIPYLLVSCLLLPLLGFIAKAETFKYSFVTLASYYAIVVLKSGGLVGFGAHYWSFLPLLAGFCAVLLAAWIVGNRHAAT